MVATLLKLATKVVIECWFGAVADLRTRSRAVARAAAWESIGMPRDWGKATVTQIVRSGFTEKLGEGGVESGGGASGAASAGSGRGVGIQSGGCSLGKKAGDWNHAAPPLQLT